MASSASLLSMNESLRGEGLAVVIQNQLWEHAKGNLTPMEMKTKEYMWTWFKRLTPMDLERILTIVDKTCVEFLVLLKKEVSKRSGDGLFFDMDSATDSEPERTGRRRSLPGRHAKVRRHKNGELVTPGIFRSWEHVNLVSAPRDAQDMYTAFRAASVHLHSAVRIADSKESYDTLTLAPAALTDSMQLWTILDAVSLRGFATVMPPPQRETGETPWFSVVGVYSLGSYIANRLEMALWRELRATTGAGDGGLAAILQPVRPLRVGGTSAAPASVMCTYPGAPRIASASAAAGERVASPTVERGGADAALSASGSPTASAPVSLAPVAIPSGLGLVSKAHLAAFWDHLDHPSRVAILEGDARDGTSATGSVALTPGGRQALRTAGAPGSSSSRWPGSSRHGDSRTHILHHSASTSSAAARTHVPSSAASTGGAPQDDSVGPLPQFRSSARSMGAGSVSGGGLSLATVGTHTPHRSGGTVKSMPASPPSRDATLTATTAARHSLGSSAVAGVIQSSLSADIASAISDDSPSDAGSAPILSLAGRARSVDSFHTAASSSMPGLSERGWNDHAPGGLDTSGRDDDDDISDSRDPEGASISSMTYATSSDVAQHGELGALEISQLLNTWPYSLLNKTGLEVVQSLYLLPLDTIGTDNENQARQLGFRLQSRWADSNVMDLITAEEETGQSTKRGDKERTAAAGSKDGTYLSASLMSRMATKSKPSVAPSRASKSRVEAPADTRAATPPAAPAMITSVLARASPDEVSNAAASSTPVSSGAAAGSDPRPPKLRSMSTAVDFLAAEHSAGPLSVPALTPPDGQLVGQYVVGAVSAFLHSMPSGGAPALAAAAHDDSWVDQYAPTVAPAGSDAGKRGKTKVKPAAARGGAAAARAPAPAAVPKQDSTTSVSSFVTAREAESEAASPVARSSSSEPAQSAPLNDSMETSEWQETGRRARRVRGPSDVSAPSLRGTPPSGRRRRSTSANSSPAATAHTSVSMPSTTAVRSDAATSSSAATTPTRATATTARAAGRQDEPVVATKASSVTAPPAGGKKGKGGRAAAPAPASAPLSNDSFSASLADARAPRSGASATVRDRGKPAPAEAVRPAAATPAAAPATVRDAAVVTVVAPPAVIAAAPAPPARTKSWSTVAAAANPPRRAARAVSTTATSTSVTSAVASTQAATTASSVAPSTLQRPTGATSTSTAPSTATITPAISSERPLSERLDSRAFAASGDSLEGSPPSAYLRGGTSDTASVISTASEPPRPYAAGSQQAGMSSFHLDGAGEGKGSTSAAASRKWSLASGDSVASRTAQSEVGGLGRHGLLTGPTRAAAAAASMATSFSEAVAARAMQAHRIPTGAASNRDSPAASGGDMATADTTAGTSSSAKFVSPAPPSTSSVPAGKATPPPRAPKGQRSPRGLVVHSVPASHSAPATTVSSPRGTAMVHALPPAASSAAVVVLPASSQSSLEEALEVHPLPTTGAPPLPPLPAVTDTNRRPASAAGSRTPLSDTSRSDTPIQDAPATASSDTPRHSRGSSGGLPLSVTPGSSDGRGGHSRGGSGGVPAIVAVDAANPLARRPSNTAPARGHMHMHAAAGTDPGVVDRFAHSPASGNMTPGRQYNGAPMYGGPATYPRGHAGMAAPTVHAPLPVNAPFTPATMGMMLMPDASAIFPDMGVPGWLEYQLHAELLKLQQWCVAHAHFRRRQELRVVWDVAKIVMDTVPGATVHVFGSFMTGLATPSSDVDVLIKCPVSARAKFSSLVQTLRGHSWVSNVTAVSNAHVPVIKVVAIAPPRESSPPAVDAVSQAFGRTPAGSSSSTTLDAAASPSLTAQSRDRSMSPAPTVHASAVSSPEASPRPVGAFTSPGAGGDSSGIPAAVLAAVNAAPGAASSIGRSATTRDRHLAASLQKFDARSPRVSGTSPASALIQSLNPASSSPYHAGRRGTGRNIEELSLGASADAIETPAALTALPALNPSLMSRVSAASSSVAGSSVPSSSPVLPPPPPYVARGWFDPDAPIRLDISFESPAHRGERTTQHTREAVGSTPTLAPLVLALKQLLSVMGLNDAYSGGLSSFAVLLMTESMIHHLIRESPPMMFLYKRVPHPDVFDAPKDALQPSGGQGQPFPAATVRYEVLPPCLCGSMRDMMFVSAPITMPMLPPVLPPYASIVAAPWTPVPPAAYMHAPPVAPALPLTASVPVVPASAHMIVSSGGLVSAGPSTAFLPYPQPMPPTGYAAGVTVAALDSVMSTAAPLGGLSVAGALSPIARSSSAPIAMSAPVLALDAAHAATSGSLPLASAAVAAPLGGVHGPAGLQVRPPPASGPLPLPTDVASAPPASVHVPTSVAGPAHMAGPALPPRYIIEGGESLGGYLLPPLLSKLFLKFLRYYGSEFNPHDTIISYKDGAIPRSAVAAAAGIVDPIIVPDPCDDHSNVGRNCFRFMQVQQVLREARAAIDVYAASRAGAAPPPLPPPMGVTGIQPQHLSPDVRGRVCPQAATPQMPLVEFPLLGRIIPSLNF